MTRTLTLLPLVLLAATPAWSSPADAPSVYVMALPANVALIAVVPRDKDLFDLDLRVEVVLPLGCGDRMAGLLRHGGASLDGPDDFDAVLERRAAGECKKEPSRVAARWAIRMRLPDGATRDLTIGSRAFKVARAGAKVTLDGQPPEGDVPGAPPTAAPATLVIGDVTEAKLTTAKALPGSAGTAVEVTLAARWPKCAGPLLGLLGRGDASSKFALDRFTPIALAPLDGSCGAAVAKPRPATARAVVRVAQFSVGAQRLALPAATAAKK